ncbi:hypothetical protein E5E91_06915 [Deinococcus radiodurans R1 = ATCC 13939 = DSM 20539]|uniref:Uncharacterized protein n=2 Tax=Deinococcus radiodurans TaxID=1299 RepID=Q9RUQ1_DEIRA|nr:hypothetical protein DR_1331 [Deinococcus radiodurans R1 = ATCC 13939 = DSM 20539]QEM70797.1 hypothetical protein DXG80_02830 [Deinococcus radiodurans]UDL00449.1 hypothetical protein E5E91_06915 [Deinococcus radiodurans R1 = ATCC 13939 = DSM 20539]
MTTSEMQAAASVPPLAAARRPAMTDPGDLATTDSNVAADLPDATSENINPGLGGEGKQEVIKENEKDQAKIATESPDPLDL